MVNISNKVTKILEDGNRRVSLIGPGSESTSFAQTRQIEIADADSSRRVFVYIESIGKAIKRARQLFRANISVDLIAEELEDEFEAEPSFSHVIDLGTDMEDDHDQLRPLY